MKTQVLKVQFNSITLAKKFARLLRQLVLVRRGSAVIVKLTHPTHQLAVGNYIQDLGGHDSPLFGDDMVELRKAGVGSHLSMKGEVCRVINRVRNQKQNVKLQA